MRAGLVSFGQGLYFGLGAYAAGTDGQLARRRATRSRMVARSGRASRRSPALGARLPLARYRDDLLRHAEPRVLDDPLRPAGAGRRRSARPTASTSPPATFVGIAAAGRERPLRGLRCSTAVVAVRRSRSRLTATCARTLGRLWAGAIRDNELRVEYLGASVARTSCTSPTSSRRALAGSAARSPALAVGHVDPDLAYWTTSGEFVFVAILSRHRPRRSRRSSDALRVRAHSHLRIPARAVHLADGRRQRDAARDPVPARAAYGRCSSAGARAP